jgi:hypothetical protein
MRSEATFPPFGREPDENRMRIHDQNPVSGPPAGSAGTAGTQSSGATAGITGQGGRVAGVEQPGPGPDRVSLSNLAANLGPTVLEREAELDRLTELFSRGVYEPDPGAVAESLIDERLMSPPDEPGGVSGERG